MQGEREAHLRSRDAHKERTFSASLSSLVEEEGEDRPVEAQEDFPPPLRWQS